MNVDELKKYVSNNNQYNLPVSILEDNFITSDQLRLDFENGKYKISSLGEKAFDANPVFFENENEAVELFKKMWDANIRYYARRLPKTNNIIN